MKKVQCPACGATGVVFGQINNSFSLGRPPSRCDKCEGFGFILVDTAEFAKNKIGSLRNKNVRFIGFGEYTEFTGLCKVRNIGNRSVWIPVRGCVPYGVFYKEHRTPRY